MRKIRRHNKKGITLVELIVAMTLTAIFMASCITLILPIERIYTEINETSRAQILADTVVNSLRAECSNASVLNATDVVILDSEPFGGSGNGTYGNVLRFRRNNTYFDTIASNYLIDQSYCNAVRTADMEDDNVVKINGTTSRTVYRMTFVASPTRDDSTNVGHLHYGYFNSGTSGTVPYDFTNPLVSGAYGDFLVCVHFDSIECGNDTVPDYVNCTITVLNRSDEVVYSRTTVICF